MATQTQMATAPTGDAAYFRRIRIKLLYLLDFLRDPILAGARLFRHGHVCFSAFDFVLRLASTNLVEEFFHRLAGALHACGLRHR